MIPITSLRIGNWVNDRQGRPIRVTSLVERGVLSEYVSGIPLTEEVLLKAGFERHIGWQDTWLFNGKVGMNIHNGKWEYNNLSFTVDVPFVHQLQNLYHALTGKELEIRL